MATTATPRPPLLGRACTVAGSSEERLRLEDEESLRDELARLRSAAQALKRETEQARKKVREAEKESYVKDKRLQELLANAKCGSGAPGEAIDQLREDLQLLLTVKARNHEARGQLDQREQKYANIYQELKGTSSLVLEEEVAVAKAEAKAKAEEWRESRKRESGCFNDADSLGRARQLRQEADELVARIAAVENDFSGKQRRRVYLEDERRRFENDAQACERQIQALQSKRQEVEVQMEDCRRFLESLPDITAERDRLKAEVERKEQEVKKAREACTNRQLKNSATAISVKGWEVSEHLLSPGAAPLRDGADSKAGELLWRFRQAVEASGCSAIDLLKAEDKDNDGRVSVQELTAVMHRLGVPESHASAVQQMVDALHESIASGGRVSVVDFALALPLQARPLGPPEEALGEALRAVAWGCRRRRTSEAELRSRLQAWLADASADFRALSQALCMELGLEVRFVHVLAEGLEARREGLLMLVPSWRSPTDAERVAILLRFLRDLAARRDSIAPLLEVPGLALEAFVDLGRRMGPHWSSVELEEVALVSEILGAAAQGGAPCVDAGRLVRASRVGGLEAEFPEQAAAASPQARQELEDAARDRPRRVTMNEVPDPDSPLPPSVAAQRNPALSLLPGVERRPVDAAGAAPAPHAATTSLPLPPLPPAPTPPDDLPAALPAPSAAGAAPAAAPEPHAEGEAVDGPLGGSGGPGGVLQPDPPAGDVPQTPSPPSSRPRSAGGSPARPRSGNSGTGSQEEEEYPPDEYDEDDFCDEQKEEEDEEDDDDEDDEDGN